MSKNTTSETPKAPVLSKKFFAERREQLFQELPDNSVLVVVSNPEQRRSNDTDFKYRQSSDVLYLSGFPEPESVLVFTNVGGKPRFVMFVRPKNRATEIWTGIRSGTAGAKKKFGANDAHSIEEFSKVMAELLQGATRVYYRFGLNDGIDEKFKQVWADKQLPLYNPDSVVHRMRLVKTDAELEVMRYASIVSAEAHKKAMQATKPGVSEGQVEVVLRTHFGFGDAPHTAYDSIVAGGNNAVVLHYTENSHPLRDGDLLLVDAACEYLGYASDITRTYPVSGKFTKAQRELYQLVLDANLAGIQAAKPGATLAEIHEVASRTLRHGLVKLGILPAEMMKKNHAKKAVAKAKEKNKLDELLYLGRFYMHGTGHWLGLDVHDVAGQEGSKSIELKPGMVFTIEPGLYFDKDDKLVPKKYRGIGIRIEDDVVITEDGCEILTSDVPKSVEEIEQLMKR